MAVYYEGTTRVGEQSYRIAAEGGRLVLTLDGETLDSYEYHDVACMGYLAWLWDQLINSLRGPRFHFAAEPQKKEAA